MINIIVAISENNAIGKDNQLLFSLKKDLQHFKNLTTNNVVIMGRKTYESIGKPLPNRINLVLTRENKENIDNIETFSSIEDAIEYSKTNYPNKEIFIIGGGQVYLQALNKEIVDKLYITKVKKHIEDADTYFPNIDYHKKWNIKNVEIINENGLEYFIFEAVKIF